MQPEKRHEPSSAVAAERKLDAPGDMQPQNSTGQEPSLYVAAELNPREVDNVHPPMMQELSSATAHDS